jgi:hypothetical protein
MNAIIKGALNFQVRTNVFTDLLCAWVRLYPLVWYRRGKGIFYNM